jgi:hypothetical protein
MKRKQFEAQQIALQVGKLFGGASEQANRMGRGQGTVTTNDPLKPGRTTGAAMMKSLGFNPKSGRNKVKH